MVPLVSLPLFLRCFPIAHQHPSRIPRSVVLRTLLPGGLLDLGGVTVTDKAVVGLELLESLVRVVDQAEAGRLASTELCANTEDGDLVLVDLVELGELSAEVILGDSCSSECQNQSSFSDNSTTRIRDGRTRAVGVEDVPEQIRQHFVPTAISRPQCRSQSPRSSTVARPKDSTYTTICFLPKRGFLMNLRVRNVMGPSDMLGEIPSETELNVRSVSFVGAHERDSLGWW